MIAVAYLEIEDDACLAALQNDHDQLSHHPDRNDALLPTEKIQLPRSLTSLMLSTRSIAARAISATNALSFRRVGYATISEDIHKYKVVVVGAGAPFSAI